MHQIETSESQPASRAWDSLYEAVLMNGIDVSPRNRKTRELTNVSYELYPHQHLDPRIGRNISLDYIFREFLWFLGGDPCDTNIKNYAKLWEACINSEGIINSNYGQYLFSHNGTFPELVPKVWEAPIFLALNQLIADRDSRRCWVPIFQTYHHYDSKCNDYPCTTGLGFTIREDKLYMTVHMRSQDLWHGAANDEAVCFLFQLLAQAYLRDRSNGFVNVGLGTITHYIDSLHFYERHIQKATTTLYEPDHIKVNQDIAGLCVQLAAQGFTRADIKFLIEKNGIHAELSNNLLTIVDIPGHYGREDKNYHYYINDQTFNQMKEL